MTKWHVLDTKAVFENLESNKTGLTEDEAAKRLQRYGYNEIVEKKKISPLMIFLEQFKSILVIILIIASAIAIFLGEIIDGSLIIAIVIANSIFGFVQDYKAEKSIEALKKMSVQKARVLRNGNEMEILSRELVPGDIIILDEGDRVPADARIIESIDMKVDESALTGESMSVGKTQKTIDDAVLAERKNMVFMNTDIVRGKGRAVVVSTGMKTEIGTIAREVEEIKKEKTPFQKRLDKLGKEIGLIIMAICVVVFVVQLLAHTADVLTIFLVSVSLAVAAIPEGLPAVTTLTLALGVRRMVKRNALVRRLPVVEGLGSVNVICSDKTGTITEGKMKVKQIFFDKKFSDTAEQKNFQSSLFLKSNILCNNAAPGYEDHQKKFLGDPTEQALLAFALDSGLKKEDVDKEFRRTNEIPFSSERKMMTTFHAHETTKSIYAITKGAPELVLQRCNRYYEKNEIMLLDEKKRNEFMKHINEMASNALRVLGFAYKEGEKSPEKDMIFLGMIGMLDPPRKEVKEAMMKCKDAHIRTIMITGDNKITAQAIAKEIGLEGNAMEGNEVEIISDENFEKVLDDTNIFARVSPLHKVKIIKALKKKGYIIAMTGDGVNDAPALKAADVGVSMGIKGTDVAKQTADIILIDDNFATIVSAVEEGRRIFDNVKRFVTYLLSANTGEVLVVFIASLLGRIPITAAQLLWLNLLTDGLPALAIGMDAAEPNIMKRNPTKGKIMDKPTLLTILIIGCVKTPIILSLFFFEPDPIRAQTYVFTALVVFELAKIQVIRSAQHLSLFSNKYLIISIVSSIALQFVVLYTPLSIAFKTAPLSLDDWGKILTAGAISVMATWLAIKHFVRYDK
ncbi:MAG: calcium-translocating P-type ATPase, PMCA-type [Candidatus Aenigmatarchaeota archaeon]